MKTRRLRIPSSAIHRVPLVALPFVAAACVGQPVARQGVPNVALDQLRRAHGGVANWERQSAVRFRYRLRPNGSRDWIEVREVAFRRGEFHRLWVQLHKNGPRLELPLDATPTETRALLAHHMLDGGTLVDSEPDNTSPRTEGSDLDDAPSRDAAVPLDKLDLDALDYGLRSIRYLFQLPLSTSAGAWEVRTLLAGENGREVGHPVEVVSLARQSPQGPCLLFPDLEDGRLAGIVYAPRHPYLDAKPMRATFSEYAQTEEISIAHRRIHSRSESGDEPFYDPFPEIQGPPPSSPVALEEEIYEVAFLSHDEAMALYPLESDLAEEVSKPAANSEEERAGREWGVDR